MTEEGGLKKYDPSDPWTQTYTGKIVDLRAPRVENVDLVDIAHSLALQCRYNGNIKTFYSVAEHCVRMSRLTEDPELAMYALLHDAHETYVQDIVVPVKHYLNGFREHYLTLERIHEEAVAQAFNLQWPPAMSVRAWVKWADRTMGATEYRDLHLVHDAADWGITETPLTEKIEPWGWKAAKDAFLERFFRLDAERRGEL